jgi:hypothetical protein
VSDTNTDATPRKHLGVFAIIEKKDPNKPAYWLNIGTAFTNRDGSLTVYLDAFPIGTHKLQIREARAWEDTRTARRVPDAPGPEARP